MSSETLVVLQNGCKLMGLPPSGGVTKYFGVPFAKPPVGPLRFESPVPCEPWEGVLAATTLPKACPQVRFGDLKYYNTEPSEDCLYLNLYVPQDARVKGQLPVMVWIFGGGYIQGTMSTYDCSPLARNGVVVVAMNYRVGPFGFLFRENGISAVGIQDQQLALKWVKENVAAFGGDPNLVTIFGESAGGGSVAHHILSPSSKGLFERAIVQSGAPGCPWATFDREKGKQMAQKLAASCSCLAEDGGIDMEKLKSIPAETIIEMLESDFALESAPIIDGSVISNSAVSLSDIPKFNISQIDILMGFCSEEGLMFVPFFWEDFLTLSCNFTEFSFLKDDQLVKTGATVLLNALYPNPERVDASLVDEVMEHFFGNRVSVKDRLLGFEELMGDLFFITAGIDFADKMAQCAKSIYLYEYSHSPSVVTKGPNGSVFDPKVFGCYHGADLIAHFTYERGPQPDDDHVQQCMGMPHSIDDLTAQEKTLTARMVSYWTDFAKYGTPDKAFSTYNPEHRNYTRITADGLESRKDYMKRRYDFWQKQRKAQ